MSFSAYPQPITTTSPPPPDVSLVEYPKLMTTHQRMQGYTPSLASMFSGSMRAPPIPQSLLFIPEEPSTSSLPSSIYSQDTLPRQFAPPAKAHSHAYLIAAEEQKLRTEKIPGAYPTLPPPVNTRITRSLSRRDPVPHDLKTVNLPRECLPRFLTIAALNTAQNRETCGLLLGKDKGNKYVVTTLLIPKQHSTSDTCTMEEEELVMQFTEERNLITLGWVSDPFFRPWEAGSDHCE